ncbi:MAG: hypothetical protein WBO24_11465 [Nitrospirales bacterium]
MENNGKQKRSSWTFRGGRLNMLELSGIAFTKKELSVGRKVMPWEAGSVKRLVAWMGQVIEGIGETKGPGDVG